jgi:hypothetical protein
LRIFTSDKYFTSSQGIQRKHPSATNVKIIPNIVKKSRWMKALTNT